MPDYLNSDTKMTPAKVIGVAARHWLNKNYSELLKDHKIRTIRYGTSTYDPNKPRKLPPQIWQTGNMITVYLLSSEDIKFAAQSKSNYGFRRADLKIYFNWQTHPKNLTFTATHKEIIELVDVLGLEEALKVMLDDLNIDVEISDALLACKP